MAHTTAVTVVGIVHPRTVVAIVAVQNQLTLTMQRLPVAVVVAELQDQPFAVLPVRISPFVMQIVVVLVVVPVHNSVLVPVLRLVLVVLQVQLTVFPVWRPQRHLTWLPVDPVRLRPFQIVVLFRLLLHPGMDSCIVGMTEDRIVVLIVVYIV